MRTSDPATLIALPPVSDEFAEAATGATPRRGPGRPRKDSALPGETKASIKRAATELFAEKGFHGTGVTEIGDRAGVRRGSLYYYIRAKDDLLWQIVSDHLEAAGVAVKNIADSDAVPADKLRALIRHQVGFVIDRRLEMRIFERDRDAMTGERALALQHMLDEVADQWRSVFREGQQAGEFTSADPVLINAVITMVNATHRWFREGGDKTPHEVADSLADLVLSGLTR